MSSPFHRTADRLRFVHRAWRYRLRVEPAEVAFLLQHYPPGCIGLDIGAHKGAFTYWMARKSGPAGSVIAFEPLPELAGYLRHIAHIYPFPRLTVAEMALSDQGGTRTLYRPHNEYSGMTSFVPSDHPQGYDKFQVHTRTLDEYLAHHPRRPVGFIKCDVEGHELEVLRGARRILLEDRPVLLLECEDHRHGGGQLERVTGFLSELGYHCFALFRAGICPLEECLEDMQRVRLGVDAYRNFGFLPMVKAQRVISQGRVILPACRAA